MYAVIKTGGKQYRVAQGQRLDVERVAGEEGELSFEPLMLVDGAAVTVDGGMPQHGHGLPTRPLVGREVAAGRYSMEGMKFSMPGWWEIKLAIEAAQGDDTVVFNTVVGPQGIQR